MKNQIYHNDKMQSVIDEFYEVFNYPAPTEHLNVCDCGGCIDDNIKLEMRTLPLRELKKAFLSI